MDKKQYRPLTIPKLSWQKKELSTTYGELVAQPLEPGFGITLGNALRRIIYAAVEGAAVTSVVIKGVNNEFSSLPGVEEDAMQLVLNIKNIVVRSKDGKSGKMHLKVSGPGVARVIDITTDENLELINGELVLAHIADKGELEIEFVVESGRGYMPAQWPVGKALQEDGRIYLDSMFSPVRKVMFDVEKTRVGKDIDFDKLTLRITTDGSENAVDVLHYAVSVLRTQLEHFMVVPEIPFNKISAPQEEARVLEPVMLDHIGLKGISADFLLKPIDELEFSVRAHNCLVNAGIVRVIDLINLPEEQVLKIKNFGRKSLGEVRENMKSFGLSFGMDIKEDYIKQLLREKGHPVDELA